MVRKILTYIPLLVLFVFVSLVFAQDEAPKITDYIGMYEIVAGVFLPLLVSVFVREQWTKEKKTLVAFLFVLLASAGYIFYSGEWSLTDIGGTILKILLTTVTTYKLFWNPSGITNGLEMGVGLTNK